MFSLVEKAGSGRKADVVEWHFARMLQNYLDPEVRKARPDLVKAALLARQIAERTAVPSDERVHYWLHNMVDAADAERRKAEDRLFIGNLTALEQAATGLSAVIGKDGTGGKYAEAQARAKAVADAFALRDRVWARAPYLAQWVTARLHASDPALSDALTKLIQGTRDLAAELDRDLAEQREGARRGPAAGVARQGQDRC